MKFILAPVVTCLLLFSSPINSKAQTTYWWNDAVFYEVFVRSYYDDNGNGIGDFKGLTAKLDYIQSLGVNAIWLMPINPSPSYHGYDVTNYRQINSQFGSTQDFKDFMTEAHNRNIKVIIDFVMNHTSSQNSWFTKSKNNDAFYRNFYRWSATNPGYKGPWGQTVWHQSGSGSYYYGIFASSMPDLNYTYQPVKDSMFAISSFWLDSMKIDGFRCDAAPYLIESGSYPQNTPATIQFWKDFHNHYKSVNPDAMAVGEVWMSTDTILRYTGDGFDFCFEFDLSYSILDAVNNANATITQSLVQYINSKFPFAQYGTFLSNHDQDRVMSTLNSNVSKAKAAAAIYLTLPGVPFIYYGEEIGMTGSGADENKRTPMQWTAAAKSGFTTGTPWRTINSNYTTVNVATEEADTASLLNWYKKLIATRNNTATLRRGSYLKVTTSAAPLMSYIRSYQGQNLLVVINTGSQNYSSATLTLTGAGISDGVKTLTDLLSSKTVIATLNNSQLSNFAIGPYGSAVYEINESNSISSADEGSITFYPNPVDKELNITVNNASAANLWLEISDLNGKIVKTTVLDNLSSLYTEDVSSLPRGIYIVHLYNTISGSYFKMVKQ